MPTKSFLSFAGFMLLIAATYCPLLRPLVFPSMDLYQLNQSFGIVVLLVGIIGILGIVLRQRPLARLCAWMSLLLVIIAFIAAYLKVHHVFSFIPFKSIAGYLTRQVKFKWGWYLLFAGPVLAIIGIVTTKSGKTIPNANFK
jgi:uncharacterized membrane protein